RQDVVRAGIDIAVLTPVELDGCLELVAQVVEIPLDGLGGHSECLREGGRVGEPPLLDLVVDGLEPPPEGAVLERSGATHAAILSDGPKGVSDFVGFEGYCAHTLSGTECRPGRSA